MAAAIPSSGIHWLDDLKLDISTHSRAWRHLRNRAFIKASLLVDNVDDLSALPERRKKDLVEGIEQDLKHEDFYLVAQADAFNRTAAFLQHSARQKGKYGFLDPKKAHREQVDAALCVLLSSRKDLIGEFTKCMNSELSPGLRKILYTRILRDETIHAGAYFRSPYCMRI